MISRKRDRDLCLKILLECEALLLAAAAALWLPTHHRNGSLSCDGLIALLSLAMGLQSITGKRINLSSIPTIVFTSTLTNIVIALTDMLASREFVFAPDTRRQTISFLLYFFGALTAGFCVYSQSIILIFLPFGAVLWAATSQIRSQ